MRGTAQPDRVPCGRGIFDAASGLSALAGVWGWNRRESAVMTHGLPILELLDPADIHVQFVSSAVSEAIVQLLRAPLLRECRDEAVAQEVMDAVLKREAEGSTACGPVALPHARHPAVRRFVLAMGINAGGVIEGHAEPRLIFAFVSPEAKREDHLRLLAGLARFAQNPAVVDQLTSATSAEQVGKILGAVSA